MFNVHHFESENSSLCSELGDEQLERSMQSLSVVEPDHLAEDHGYRPEAWLPSPVPGQECAHTRQVARKPCKPRIARVLQKLQALQSGSEPMEFNIRCQLHTGYSLNGVYFCTFCAGVHCKAHAYSHCMQSGHDVFLHARDATVHCFRCRASGSQKIVPSKVDIAEQNHPMKHTLKRFLSSSSLADSRVDALESARPATSKGMQNLGNTCYFNSAIQAMRSSQYLEPFMRKYAYALAHGTDSVYASFLSLLNQFYAKDKSTVDATSFIKQFSQQWKLIGAKGQQDAQEFVTLLLDSLKEEIERTGDEEIMQDFYRTFRSKYRVSLHCNACAKLSVHDEYFFTISLSLPRLLLYNEQLSIDYLLNEFVRPLLCDYKCERCDTKSIVYSMAGTEYPDALILHLARFSIQHSSTGRKKRVNITIEKDNRFVNFDNLLTVRPEGGCELEYELSAVVVHIGESYSSGHYICYSKIDNCWFYTDDTTIRRVPFTEVLDAQAYMLVYNKLN